MQKMWRRGPDGEIVRIDPASEASGGGQAASGDAAATRPARLRIGLRLGARDTYDYLGSILLISVVWMVTASTAGVGGYSLGLRLFRLLPGNLPAFFAVLAGLAGLTLAGGPLAAGIFRFARNAAARQEPELFDLSWGFRRSLGRSLQLAGAQLLLGVVLAANCYFYWDQRHPVLAVVGAVFGYGLLIWGMMCLYQWPLLVEQEIPVGKVIRKSGLLVLDNFLYTLALGVLVSLLAVLLWATVVGGVLLGAGGTAMLLTQATRELLRKYHVLPPDPTLDPIAGETHELGGFGWHE